MVQNIYFSYSDLRKIRGEKQSDSEVPISTTHLQMGASLPLLSTKVKH